MDAPQFADCGPFLAPIVRPIIEECVPEDVVEEHGDSLFFICMSARDGLRLTKHVRENFEVIILSDHVAPSKGEIGEGNPVFRYFMYVVLHEVAHAIRGHSSAIYDGTSPEESAAQEEEADSLATKWFNDWAVEVGCESITEEELGIAQEKNQDAMQALWWEAPPPQFPAT